MSSTFNNSACTTGPEFARHLLPYHRLGESKLGELGYPPENLIPGIRHPSEEEVEKAGQVLRKAGLTVIIGG